MTCTEFSANPFGIVHPLYRPRSLSAISSFETGTYQFKPDYEDAQKQSTSECGICVSSQGYKSLLVDMETISSQISNPKKLFKFGSTISVASSYDTKPKRERKPSLTRNGKMKSKLSKDVGGEPYLKKSSKWSSSLHTMSVADSSEALLASGQNVKRINEDNTFNQTRPRKISENKEKAQQKINNIISWVQNKKKSSGKFKLKRRSLPDVDARVCAYLQSSEPQSNKIQSLSDVLNNADATDQFRNFLLKELSEENLDFWLEVEDYKKQKPSKQKKLATKIFSTYCTSSSLKEVNLDSCIVSQTKENLLFPDSNTFNAAQNQIFRLMATDSFPRYIAVSTKC